MMEVTSIVGIGSVMPSKVREDKSLFDSYVQQNLPETKRERENWNYFDGTEYRQWNAAAVRQAVQDGLSLSTFNYIKKYVDVTTGAITADPFELRYDVELGDDELQARILNQKYLEDKDVGKWVREFMEFIRAGNIYRGFLKMFIDRSRDPRGTIGVEYFSPDRVHLDPNRRGKSINDNENIFISTWMSAQKIKDKYGIKNPEIENLIRMRRIYANKDDTFEEKKDKVFDTSPEYYDKTREQFLVLDRYYQKRGKSYQIFDLETGAVIAIKEEEEDAYALAKLYRDTGMAIKILPRVTMKTYVRTTIPGLSTVVKIQDGPTELQIGRYPFFEFSSDVINGRPNTWVDQLKDPQTQLNKRINAATHIIQTNANNMLLLEQDAAEDPETLHKIGKTRNHPGSYEIVNPGGIGKIKHLEKGSTNVDQLNFSQSIINMIKEITPAVPAVQSIDDSESGVLLQTKLAQAQISMERSKKLLMAFWDEFGEAYIKAFRQTYTYPMVFKGSDNEIYYLNIPGGIDVSTMTRMKVTVSQSPTSETYRRQLLQSYLAISQYLHDPYTRSELSRVVVGKLPGLPEGDNKRLEAAAELSSESQKLAIMANMRQTQAALEGGGAAAPPGQTPTPTNKVDPETALTQAGELEATV